MIEIDVNGTCTFGMACANLPLGLHVYEVWVPLTILLTLLPYNS